MVAARLKIGLLIPQEGPAGIWAPSGEACALLALAEINAAGGLLGRHAELVIADAGNTGASAAEAAARMVRLDGVTAVVAMLPSFARGPVARTLRDCVPFVYTPQFEGGDADRGVVTVGETTEELLRPSLAWLSEVKKAGRYFLVGNDYVWPWQSMSTARRIVREVGGQVVGELVLPFGIDDYEPVMAKIRQAHPDAVLSWLLGHESIGFNRAFAAAGLASRMLRFSSAIDETILYAIGADCTENLYVASAYFSSLRSRNNDAFLERYHSSFGDSPPPPNGFGQSLYEGIYCLAGLADAAGGLHPLALRRKIGRAAQERTARGFEPLAVAGARRPVHLAAAEGHEFRLIAV